MSCAVWERSGVTITIFASLLSHTLGLDKDNKRLTSTRFSTSQTMMGMMERVTAKANQTVQWNLLPHRGVIQEDELLHHRAHWLLGPYMHA